MPKKINPYQNYIDELIEHGKRHRLDFSVPSFWRKMKYIDDLRRGRVRKGSYKYTFITESDYIKLTDEGKRKKVQYFVLKDEICKT